MYQQKKKKKIQLFKIFFYVNDHSQNKKIHVLFINKTKKCTSVLTSKYDMWYFITSLWR